jgi:hypothetical protein
MENHRFEFITCAASGHRGGGPRQVQIAPRRRPREQRLIMRFLALSPEVAAITKGLSRPTDAAAVLGPVKVRPGSGGA